MSTSAKLILEILDSSNQWVDRTTDFVRGVIQVGRSYLAYTANIGQAQLTLNNRAQTYNSTSNLDEGYRVRVKASGASLGNCLQVQHSGGNGFNTVYFYQDNSPPYVLNDVFTLTWDARAQYDSQYNAVDRALIESSANLAGSINYSYTNKWQTYTLTATATGPSGAITRVRFDLYNFPVGAATNTRQIEYRNISLTKNGGANLLTNGNFANGFSNWTSSGAALITNVTNDYWIIFNGVVEKIDYDPFVTAGLYQIHITCTDLMRWMKQKVDLPLQKNQTADQLNTTLLGQINNGSYNKSVLLDVPLSYYRLDESSGSTAQDISGNALNGTYVGGVTLGVAGHLYGDPDTAITLDGSTGYVTLPAVDLHQSSFSLECWFNVSTLAPAYQMLVSVFGSLATDKMILAYVESAGALVLDFYSDSWTSAGGLVSTNTWYHIAFTYNVLTRIGVIYLNGVSVGTTSVIGPLNATPSAIYVGTIDTTTDWLSGSIDEVAIYNFPLTAAQVSRHYNAGIGTYNTVKLPGKQQTSGLQDFPVSFDRYDKQSVAISDALRQVANSEYGIQWMDRDGTFRFGARDYLPKLIIQPAKLTLADRMTFQMQPVRNSAQLLNRVILTYHPRQIVTSPVVLGQITSSIQIPGTGGGNRSLGSAPPSGTPTSQTVTLTFVDGAGNKIGGDSVISPVATTDYLVNEKQDGSGHDYTIDSAFVIGPIIISASQVTITLTNKATGALYVNKLQIRGDAVYTYNPITIAVYDPQGIISREDRPYVSDLAFSADGNYANSLALYLLGRFGSSYLEVPSVTIENQTRLNGVDLMGIELMDTISISDTQTGLSSIRHLISEIIYTLDLETADGVKGIAFNLERMDQTTYWTLDSTTYSVLGSTTRLYI